MKRPEQHIIETKSQRIFEKLVPVEWVIREIKPDYGVDYLVEIFKNNESTGKTFFVQLKGSDQVIEKNTFKKQFEVENLNYFNSLALPVLIILVSVNTEQIWAIWANNLSKAFNIKPKQKTISINLDSKYLIVKDKFTNFENDLESTKKIGLSITFDGDKEKLLSEKILNWINKYYKDAISTEFSYLPNHIEISFNSLSNNELKVSVIAPNSNDEIIINDIKEDNLYLHRPKFDNNDVNILNKEILKILAINFAKYNVKGSLEIFDKIISHLEINNDAEFISFDPLGLLVLAKSNNEMQRFNNLIQKIIDLKNYNLFFFCDLAYFYADAESEELQKYRIENLNYLINKTSDNPTKGTCSYNIANILKSSKKPDKDEAIKYYFKSRKLYPDYENRNYWWRELAGLLFDKKHYKISESFYRKSLQLDNSNVNVTYSRLEKKNPPKLIYSLIADCLFMQGKFSEAHKVFENYFSETNSEIYEWILKDMVSMELIKMKLDAVTPNKKESLIICEKTLMMSSNEEIIISLTKAIELDPMNSLAWFNLGVALDKNKDFDKSLFSFITAGTISTGDKEAQFNALLICFTQQNLELLQVLLFYIIEKHGDLIINDFTDYLMTKNNTLEIKLKFIKAFTELFETVLNIKNSA